MSFKYLLPDEQGQPHEYETTSNSVIIIGANGAGKSKLGAWIEQQNFEDVHRIGAQRNLNFNENIALKSYSQAESLVFYGSFDPYHKSNKVLRWDRDHYTTKMISDFEDVLAALIAKKNNENDDFITDCKKAEQENKESPQTPTTAIDKLYFIWNEIFPQRKLQIKDSNFYAFFEKEGIEEVYSANQMSDGERSVLYLAAQVLCVPENKTLIIDEPELHLHRSIMNRLWLTFERYRSDCLFIYITHDTEFAAMHNNAKKIWIRDFDGTNWKVDSIENEELPEDLLLNIIGSRKNVLFVEGEKSSYDTQLYTALYPQYHVIACGSCTQVIARTKAFKNNPVLHHYDVFGIIDRDFRSDYEIEKYKADNIYTLNVAEVENLFLVEELLRLVALHLGRTADEIFYQIKDYVINQRFAKQLNGQICQSIVAEIKYKLMSTDISKKDEKEAKSSLNTLYTSIKYDEIKTEQEVKFQTALSSKNYAEVIKVFNEKNIAKTIGHFFGLQDNVYCSTIIALLQREKREDIINALARYLPTEIPRRIVKT